MSLTTKLVDEKNSYQSSTMQDKYQIPGLFIKPSTKVAPKRVIKPVEAKLTLSPIEGTMSLTTKLVDEKNSYQSSIFTPSKSPVLDARMQQRSAIGEKYQNSTPSAKPISVTSPLVKHKQDNEVTANTSQALISNNNLRSVQEAEVKSEEESEWEYYTETEPSDTEEPKKDGMINSVPVIAATK